MAPPNILPIVDLAPFLPTASATDADRRRAGRELVAACHQLGFVKIRGHGVPRAELDAAFAWVRQLFALPLAAKMKAPHPDGPMPHRGYSGIAQEKVYSGEDIQQHAAAANVHQELRKISDFKESFEIGSERDDYEPNIWLPEAVLPGFRSAMSGWYERFHQVGAGVLEALSVGLDLDPADRQSLLALGSARHSQLRLLHYPAIGKEQLGANIWTRLPAHRDISAFTLVFQEDQGGLEFRHPRSGQFVQANPEEDVVVLNVGNMLERFSNGYFVSVMHRVSLPDELSMSSAGLPARYSIPFFVGPAPFTTIAPLPRFISSDNASKYDPIQLGTYRQEVMKYQYEAK